MATLEIYKAILKEAQEGGYLELVPENPEDIEKEARYYMEEADKAAKLAEFKNDKTIKAIRNLAEGLAKQEVGEIFGDNKETWKGLPVPENPLHDATPIPMDFTEIGDKQLRRLHGEYNAYLARARWNLSVVTNKLSAATTIRDEVYRQLYKQYSTDLHLKGEKPTKDLIDSFVREDEKYKEKDALVRKHQEDVVSYKALVEIYSGYIDRLSRDWTMRIDEDKRAY